ncbi:MAG TPA: hypothetical protein VIM79_12975 [Niastella sp.]
MQPKLDHKVINRFVRHDWLAKDPFANFKMTLREVERIALTETEPQTLTAQQFPTDRPAFLYYPLGRTLCAQ